jgi:hypothetical protein
VFSFACGSSTHGFLQKSIAQHTSCGAGRLRHLVRGSVQRSSPLRAAERSGCACQRRPVQPPDRRPDVAEGCLGCSAQPLRSGGGRGWRRRFPAERGVWRRPEGPGEAAYSPERFCGCAQTAQPSSYLLSRKLLIALGEKIALPPKDLAGVLHQRSATFRPLHLAPDRVFAARLIVKDDLSNFILIQAGPETTGIVAQAVPVNTVEKGFAFAPIFDFSQIDLIRIFWRRFLSRLLLQPRVESIRRHFCLLRSLRYLLGLKALFRRGICGPTRRRFLGAPGLEQRNRAAGGRFLGRGRAGLAPPCGRRR